MALPPSFANSFFTPNWTEGVDVLWGKLQAGTVENDEIIRFISDRTDASNAIARALYNVAEIKLRSNGFAKDDGASLRRTFEGLKYETGQNAKAHETVAHNLDHMILRPFVTWASQHEGRIADLKEQLGEAISDWDGLQNEVRKLKEARNAKCSLLDEAEEDLKFAPTSPGSVASTSARPRSDSGSAAASLAFAQNTATQAAQAAQQASVHASNLARNFTQRMKVSPTAHAIKNRFDRMRLEARERDLVARGKDPSAILAKEELVDEEGTRIKGLDKKDLVDQQSEKKADTHKELPKLKIDELEIAGIVKHPRDWSVIFGKAKNQVPTTAVKVPLLGTTPDAHSGEDLVLWFRENLDDLGGSLSRAHEFCRQLSEELAILRLVGELGNKFYDSSDTFYAWRAEAFTLDQVQHQINDASAAAASGIEVDRLTELPTSSRDRRASPLLTSPKINPMSPTLPPIPAPPEVPDKEPKSPTLGGSAGLSRSNTLSFLSSAYENAARNVSSSYTKLAKGGLASVGGDRFEKLKRDANDAEETYRIAIRELDDTRMQLEELVTGSFSRAQKLENERLKAIKSVFVTYTTTMASLNMPLHLSSERTALLQEAFVPASDLNSIIERYRTGPFRPKPTVWVDWYHESTDVRFGIDLRHWRDSHDKDQKQPDILPALLESIEQGYAQLPSDEERRKTWIYEVPLQYTHKLRNMTNSAAASLVASEISKFDLPVIGNAVKLWLLELAVAVVPQAMYADVKALYPSVGASTGDDTSRLDSLRTLLERLPKIHLVVLDTLLSHLSHLLNSTRASDTESDSEYLAKIGATFGPCIVRPVQDSAKTLNDRFPSLFFVDLLKNYSGILPAVLEQKNKVEEERYAPKRQRTRLIDERLSRQSVLREDTKGKERLLREEKDKKSGRNVSEDADHAPLTQEPDDVSGPTASASLEASSDTKPDAPYAEEDAQETSESNPTNAEDETKEQLEIPLPPVPEGGSGTKSPGFATPPEAPDSFQSTGETDNTEEVPVEQSTPMAVPAQPALTSTIASTAPQEEEEDLDKPLATSVSLARSTTGSSARRTPGLSTSIGSKTRGPRPMSMGGASPNATSPTGSPLPAGLAGVRARAAMFEQRRGAEGHRTMPSDAGASKQA